MTAFSNILFVSDQGEDDATAFEQAVALAGSNQAALTLVGVVDRPAANRSVLLLDGLVKARQRQLKVLQDSASTAGLEINVKVLVGKASVEIIREVLQNNRDLVVKPAGRVRRQLFASSDMNLLRNCPCPLWMIQPASAHSDNKILVAIDYEPDNPESEPTNRQLLRIAGSLALSEFSELHIVHAWELENEGFLRSDWGSNTPGEIDAMVAEEERQRSAWLTGLVDQCVTELGKDASDFIEPELHLLKGSARAVVPDCAQSIGAELIVMGTVGRTGIPGFIIGNTAEHILNHIECSVLAIKPADFISPVTVDNNE